MHGLNAEGLETLELELGFQLFETSQGPKRIQEEVFGLPVDTWKRRSVRMALGPDLGVFDLRPLRSKPEL